MDKRQARRRRLLGAIGVAALMFVAPAVARAELIFSEPFLSGTNPAAGEYAPGQALAPSGGTPQNPAVPGFSTPWQGATGLITSQSTVVPKGPVYATGGSARFQWASNVGERQIYRVLDPYTSGHSSYLISGVMELDPSFSTTSGASAMVKLLGIDGSGTYGMRWGFYSDGSEVDAVVEFRDSDNATRRHVLEHGVDPGTHRFVMQIEPNARSWYDRLSVWLDPRTGSLSSRNLVRDTANWNDPLKPVDRLYMNGVNPGLNVPVHYDEVRFGTTWADVAPDLAAPARILLDEGFHGAADTQPPGWSAYVDSGSTPGALVSRNAGDGEYEQRKVTTPAGGARLVAVYDDEADVAQGEWRDTTLVARTRFSGGTGNRNGVVFRATGVTDDASGDFYHTRINGSTLELFRFDDGTSVTGGTPLATAPLSGFDPYNRTNWYRIYSENLPTGGTDNVRIVAEVYKDTAFTNLAGRLTYLDTSADAITQPGSVGFRSYNTAGTSRSVFDDLMVVSNNRNALYYREEFSGADGSQPDGWQAFASSGISSQNDGAGEYEQQRTGTGTVAIASYARAEDIAQGKWRDVTFTAQTRFSGGAANLNGVIFRADDISGVSGSGDFYMARVSGSNLQLYRFVNGSVALLDTAPLSSFNPGNNNWYRISVENVPNPATDHVHIVAEMFKDASLTNLAGRIDYLDTAANAVTRPGGVGFRSYNTSSGTRSVFDNLTVTSSNRDLLWYDDYSDGQAPHMQAYGNKTQNVTGGKYQFEGGSGEGIGFVDLPAVTGQPEWADVEVRTLMRMGGNGLGLAGGVIARATGVEDPGGGSNTSTGDMYMYRLQRSGTDRAELYRRNDGGFTLLSSANLGFDVPSSTPLYLRLMVSDALGGVHLAGQASLYQDFREIFGEIEFLDANDGRITGPGSAGFRAWGGGTINFDNFTVASVLGWDVDADGDWSDPSKWKGGIVAHNPGVTANFSTLDVTGPRSVWLDIDRTVGGLRFGDLDPASGSWTITGPSTLTLDAKGGFPVVEVVNGEATLGVPVAGSDGLAKTGAGRLTLTQANPYTGKTLVSDGTLALSGSGSLASAEIELAAGTALDVSGTSSRYTLGSGQTLTGVGTVDGALSVEGTVAPGIGGPGILFTGDVAFMPGSILEMELNGLTAGTDRDQLDVAGQVELHDALLNLTLGFAPQVGDVLFIINNDGSDSVVGEFAGLGEGATLTVPFGGGTFSLLITYSADAASGSLMGGNDVALYMIPEPATLILLGLGAAGLLARRRRRRRNA